MDRIMITLPAELRQAMDAAAAASRQNRSAYIRDAVLERMRREEQQREEELLAEGYRESAALSEQFATEAMAFIAEATEGLWVWDE